MNAERIWRPRSVRIGDRLEVRVRGREAPGRGDGLVEGRVQPAVALRDQRRQRQEVGVEQLRVLAPLLDHGHDLVCVAQAAEDPAVGRVAGLPLPAGLEPELLEQHPRHLLRRAEHELLAREVGRARLELLDPVAEPRRDLAHAIRVDLDARVLHRRENGRERQLDALVELERAALDEALAHRRRRGGAPPRRGARGPRSSPRRRLGLELEPVLGREIVDQVGRAAGLDQVGGDHRVVDGREREVQRLRVVRDERRRRAAATACAGSQSATTHPVLGSDARCGPSSIATPTRPRVGAERRPHARRRSGPRAADAPARAAPRRARRRG